MKGQGARSLTDNMWCWFSMMLLSFALPTGGNVDCTTRCDVTPSVYVQNEGEEFCSVRMPDNPYRTGDPNTGSVIPCQIEIHSNCSGYCHIQLNFNKFDLPQCEYNITNATDVCENIDSCEYILMHERGLTLDGTELDEVKHFHGYHSETTFESKTDKILLHFCYRSETFSGRNIRIKYRSKDPTKKPPFYAGPLSVYILCLFVVLMCIAVGIIRFHPGVKKCLEPPPEKRFDEEANV